MSRPFDLLEKSIGKKVIVQTKKYEKLSGMLQAYDLHLNLWLSEVERYVTRFEGDGKETAYVIKLGNVLIRGDEVVLVSPEAGA